LSMERGQTNNHKLQGRKDKGSIANGSGSVSEDDIEPRRVVE
jgi:hypothetical protein